MKKIPFKLFIVLFPSFLIGFWVFARAQFFSHYLTAEQGAMLAPILMLVGSLLFIWPLFRDMDAMEQALIRAAKKEVMFNERKTLAANLHDSIAQSLFLMSVKLDLMKGKDLVQQQQIDSLRNLVEDVHGEVRIAIRDFSSGVQNERESESTQQLFDQFMNDTGVEIEYKDDAHWLDWSSESRSAYFLLIREGLFNIRKHTHASRVQIEHKMVNDNLIVVLRDNGDGEGLRLEYGYGLQLLSDRLREYKWILALTRNGNWTELTMQKEVRHGRI